MILLELSTKRQDCSAQTNSREAVLEPIRSTRVSLNHQQIFRLWPNLSILIMAEPHWQASPTTMCNQYIHPKLDVESVFAFFAQPMLAPDLIFYPQFSLLHTVIYRLDKALRVSNPGVAQLLRIASATATVVRYGPLLGFGISSSHKWEHDITGQTARYV